MSLEEKRRQSSAQGWVGDQKAVVARSEAKSDGSPPLAGMRRERSEGTHKRWEYETDLRGAGLRAMGPRIGPRRPQARSRRGGRERALGAA